MVTKVTFVGDNFTRKAPKYVFAWIRYNPSHRHTYNVMDAFPIARPRATDRLTPQRPIIEYRFERFIRPTGLRFKKAHVTHPELQVRLCGFGSGVGAGRWMSVSMFVCMGRRLGTHVWKRSAAFHLE